MTAAAAVLIAALVVALAIGWVARHGRISLRLRARRFAKLRRDADERDLVLFWEELGQESRRARSGAR